MKLFTNWLAHRRLNKAHRTNDGQFVRNPIYRNTARQLAENIGRPDLVERLS